MKRLLTALLVSMILVIAVSGCQEGSSEDTNRKAQLIGNENLRLEINEKNTKIADLQSQLEKCEKENKGLKAQAEKTGEGFIKMLSSINERTVELEKENATLKAKIKELE